MTHVWISRIANSLQRKLRTKIPLFLCGDRSVVNSRFHAPSGLVVSVRMHSCWIRENMCGGQIVYFLIFAFCKSMLKNSPSRARRAGVHSQGEPGGSASHFSSSTLARSLHSHFRGDQQGDNPRLKCPSYCWGHYPISIMWGDDGIIG